MMLLFTIVTLFVCSLAYLILGGALLQLTVHAYKHDEHGWAVIMSGTIIMYLMVPTMVRYLAEGLPI